jgi:FAD/FMN-containing dehydrogenase
VKDSDTVPPLTSAQALSGLERILGLQGILTAEAHGTSPASPADVAPYLTDHRRLYHGRALAVVLPRTVTEVTEVLAFCNRHGIGVVPQGGNTGYCGGATPDDSGRQIVVSLSRLNRIRHLDALNYSIVAEAGCVLAQVQRAADEAQRLFPLSLGSEGTCQVGGNLATNAGGVHVLRYGMMRDLVLGLEVALADGRLLSSLGTLRKDNTGYDVKSLFLGAEGTLGIITAASLKLFPKLRAFAAAFAAVADPRAAVALLARLRDASGDRVSSFELIPRIAVELTTRHIPGVRDPLDAPHPWYVLCELTSSRADEPLDGLLEQGLAGAMEEKLVLDAAVARGESDRAAFWKLRETIPEAQRRDGASLKHDISVPVASIPDFIEQASRWIAGHVPEGRLVAYGHVGDGNLHFNMNEAPGAGRAAFLARQEPLERAIHDLVRDFGGSFSAEHGIGRLKVGELERYAQPVELDLMRAIKRTLDPNGILNPGKVLREA